MLNLNLVAFSELPFSNFSANFLHISVGSYLYCFWGVYLEFTGSFPLMKSQNISSIKAAFMHTFQLR